MATKPMMMNMEPEDEMSMGPESMDAEMEGEGDGTYYIEIAVHPDGTFTVGRESAEYEAAEEAGAESAGQSKEEGQTYESIKDALTAVLDIVKGEGGASAQALSPKQERSYMNEGFNKDRA